MINYNTIIFYVKIRSQMDANGLKIKIAKRFISWKNT